YEFHWDLGHVVFLGIFYSVLAVAACTLVYALHRWREDVRRHGADAAAWPETFAELPAERRRCRHAYDGAAPERICEHCFDCGTCAGHAEFAARAAGGEQAGPAVPAGLNLHPGRLYHRAHTWVEPHEDGTVTVGLDGLAARCLGRPDRVRLPEPGRVLRAGERATVLERGDLCARVPSPVGGTVVARGDVGRGVLYTVEPDDDPAWRENLLAGTAARVWMLRELEWLQEVLTPAGQEPALADGGVPVGDLVQACPDADWDDLWARVWLEA
ncbi:MAG: hypothetical protein R6X35_10000, partial [Candidatus Krumholzibacteriia bacterium]